MSMGDRLARYTESPFFVQEKFTAEIYALEFSVKGLL